MKQEKTRTLDSELVTFPRDVLTRKQERRVSMRLMRNYAFRVHSFSRKSQRRHGELDVSRVLSVKRSKKNYRLFCVTTDFRGERSIHWYELSKNFQVFMSVKP